MKVMFVFVFLIASHSIAAADTDYQWTPPVGVNQLHGYFGPEYYVDFHYDFKAAGGVCNSASMVAVSGDYSEYSRDRFFSMALAALASGKKMTLQWDRKANCHGNHVVVTGWHIVN